MLIHDLFTLQSRAESEEQLLVDLALAAQQATGVDAVELLLLENPDEVVLKAAPHAPELVGKVRLSPRVGITGYALRTGEITVRHRDRKHPSEVRFPGYDEDAYASSAFAPLRVNHASVGVLIFRREQHWNLRAPERQRVMRTAEAIGACLGGWRRAYRAGMRSDTLGALSQVTQTIASSPYLEEILQLLVNVTAEQFGYKVCTVRLLDERSQELVLRATQAKLPEYQRKRSIRVGESIAGRAVVEKATILVPDVLGEQEYIGHELAAEQGLRSMACVPLTVGEHAIGVLSVYTSEPHEFEETEVKALETVAQQAAFSIERAKLQVRHTLMQEMHHRVKNNLQQVVSLLRLQLRHRHYTSLDDALNDTIGRILAISAVHDLLSRDDLDRVGLRTIAENLIGHLQQSYLGPQKQVLFEIRGDDIRLTMTQATQVALVLNELLQNAFDHGFSGREGGNIHVTVEARGDACTLWVANDGRSLPEGFDLGRDAHLGLQIVSNLARALGGTFALYDDLGWAIARVTFTRTTSD